MSQNHDIIEIPVTILMETPKAFCLRDLKDQKVWVAKSQVDYCEGDKTMQMPEWYALEKGLI